MLRRWRQLSDAVDPPRILVGETPVPVDALAGYYGNGADELHLAFNFPFITAPFEADALRSVVEETEAGLPRGAWPAWTGSNHDMSRFSSRWADDDPRKIRAALVMLLCLRGTPVLYQGDEIGLGDRPVAHEDMRDPLGVRYCPAYAGRDAMRTPLPWRRGPGGGFTDPGTVPWLPVGEIAEANVEDQRSDPSSVLHLDARPHRPAPTHPRSPDGRLRHDRLSRGDVGVAPGRGRRGGHQSARWKGHRRRPRR